ncbi:MAG: AlkZ-related protein, partial [Anaerolineales bacterium]
MSVISTAQLQAHHANTFRLKRSLQLKSPKDAIAFVNERGFVYFWPIMGVTLPSLWAAVAGDRPVANAHDDPGHVTWGWKDNLLGAMKWYYANLLRGKATVVSLKSLPYFYA